jgi:hypothetical protein
MRDLSAAELFFREIWFEPEGDFSPWLKQRRYQ